MSNLVDISITNEDGTTEVLSLDLDLEALTMRESVVLETTLGGDRFDKLMGGKAEMRPSVIQAMLYAKLKTVRPGLEVGDFDVDLTELYEVLGGTDNPKVSQLPQRG
jgi:hypothetical protein